MGLICALSTVVNVTTAAGSTCSAGTNVPGMHKYYHANYISNAKLYLVQFGISMSLR